MAMLLPEGQEGGTDAGWWAWIGRDPGWPYTVHVCLLRGAWDEPETGRGGRDLVSLVAYLFSLRPYDAAKMLADWCGIEVRRHG